MFSPSGRQIVAVCDVSGVYQFSFALPPDGFALLCEGRKVDSCQYYTPEFTEETAGHCRNKRKEATPKQLIGKFTCCLSSFQARRWRASPLYSVSNHLDQPVDMTPFKHHFHSVCAMIQTDSSDPFISTFMSWLLTT